MSGSESESGSWDGVYIVVAGEPPPPPSPRPPGDGSESIQEELLIKDEEFLESDASEIILPKKKRKNCKNTEVEQKEEEYFVPLIDKICAEHPDAANDEDFIVNEMMKVMKDIKPPPGTNNTFKECMGIYKCLYCVHVCKSASESRQHYQRTHGERCLGCVSCGLTFRYTSNLYDHERKSCKARGARLMARARDVLIARVGRAGRRGHVQVVPCRICGLHVLRAHMVQHEKMHKEKAKCSMCSAVFCNQQALRGHERAHRGERPFQCEFCVNAYTSRTALHSHRETHLNAARKVECDYCGHTFTTKGTLVQHIMKHMEPRRFHCEKCGKRFAGKSALRVHTLKHDGLPPPLACTECDRRFTEMYQLKVHMRKKHGMKLISRKMFLDALPKMAEAEIDTMRFDLNGAK